MQAQAVKSSQLGISNSLGVSPVIVSRPDSLVSSATTASWSTESSSRPTSYGSDAVPMTPIDQQQQDLIPVQKHIPSIIQPALVLQASTDPARPPRHALMRLRRVSMPAGGLPRAESKSTNGSTEQATNAFLNPAMNRLSIASARSSCESLPEEDDVQNSSGANASSSSKPASETRPSKIFQSAIPLPTRRVRLKSTRRQSHSPSGLGGNPTARESSSGSRPVSLALPTTSALVASSANGKAVVRESLTLKRSLSSQHPTTTSSTSPNNSPGKGKPSVKFSEQPQTRSIISTADFNTAKRNIRMAKKDRIANEILQTERVYVAVLTQIQEHFIDPLSTPRTASKGCDHSMPHPSEIFSQRTIKDIFSNFGDVFNLNKEILRRLEESVSAAPIQIQPSIPHTNASFLHPTAIPSTAAKGTLKSLRAYNPVALPVPREIGKTLAPVMPFLKCYSLFVGNFGSAQAILDREERNTEAWKAFLAQKKAQGVGKGLSLTAMLLCIVQRIPRYLLLLGDLLRFTDADDPDYRPLKKAVEAVEEVAEHLEASIKQHESSVAMLDLQRCLVGLDFPLITPGRRLLKSGVLVKQGHNADEERAFFLFTDILIYADIAYAWSIPGLSSSGNHAYSHSAIPSMASDKYTQSAILPNPGNSPFGGTEGSAQYIYKHRFELDDLTVTSAEGQVLELRGTVKSFSLVAATPEIKYEWVTAIREAKDELLRSRRTLLTEEEEKKRSRLRRLSMPVPPPLAERSLSMQADLNLNALAPRSAGSSVAPSPTSPTFPNEWDTEDSFDQLSALTASGRPIQHDMLARDVSRSTSIVSSRRSSYSSQIRYQNYKVYEDYNAPIWVPDARAGKCMRCGLQFAIWRRRHHCRLCGDVVCWACSTKSFAIPTGDAKGSHRIGRACDECYNTCFDDTPEEERSNPLECSIKSNGSSHSLLDNLNPIRPFMTRAVSLYEMASGASRSREGSLEVESPNDSRRSSQIGIGQGGKESIAILKNLLGQ